MTEHPINPRIRGWLESGRGVHALFGRSGYFIPSPAYGEHDRILVVSQILNWAEEGHAAQAEAVLKQAIENLIDLGAAGDAADVMLAYAIVAKDRQTRAEGSSQLLQPRWMRDALQTITDGQTKMAEQ